MKNKGLSLLLLLLGGAAVYYYYKNGKKKYKGSVIVDPLDKGEFVPDVTNSVEQIATQLNSADSVQFSILDQIKEMQRPNEVINYNNGNKQNIESYQTFYATINGKKVGVPYSI
jgi:predicted aldo/keto reductase-like oxidoreductase